MDEASVTLKAAEQAWISLHGEQNRLGIGCFILHFKATGSFPKKRSDISPATVEYASLTLGMRTDEFDGYMFSSRSYGRHLAGIREFLGVRRATNEDARNAESHILTFALSGAGESELKEQLVSWFREQKIELPAVSRQKTIISAAFEAGNTALFRELHSRLNEESRAALHALLDASEDRLPFLKSDPGRASLQTVLSEVEKLKIIRELCLPENLTEGIAFSRLKPLYLRAGTESAWDMKRHPEHISLSLLALLCFKRRSDIIDARRFNRAAGA